MFRGFFEQRKIDREYRDMQKNGRAEYDEKIYFNIFQVDAQPIGMEYLLFYTAGGSFIPLSKVQKYLNQTKMAQIVSARKGYIGVRGSSSRVESLTVVRKPSASAQVERAIKNNCGLDYEMLLSQMEQGHFSFLPY